MDLGFFARPHIKFSALQCEIVSGFLVGWKISFVQQLLFWSRKKFWEYFASVPAVSASKLVDEKQGCLPGPQKLNWTLLWQKWMGFWNSWQVTQPLVWPHWCTMLVFINFQYSPIYGDFLNESKLTKMHIWIWYIVSNFFSFAKIYCILACFFENHCFQHSIL